MPGQPERTSRVLQKLPRGPATEVRISLDTIGESRPFVSLRVWERAGWGERPWLPSRRGITLRVNELSDVLKAIEQAAGLVAGGDPCGR